MYHEMGVYSIVFALGSEAIYVAHDQCYPVRTEFYAAACHISASFAGLCLCFRGGTGSILHDSRYPSFTLCLSVSL